MLRHVTEILGADVAKDPTAEEALAGLATLHEELTQAQRHFLAEHMLDSLRVRLSLQQPLDNVGINILSLTDPYITRSDQQTEARMVLSAAFERQHWATRSFEDLVSIGNALADLAFSAPGARERWEEFYDHFATEDERRVEALDVALAGLSSISVAAFAAIANSAPFDDDIVDRWEIYLPTLIRTSGAAAVEVALSQFVDQAPAARTKDLRAIAESRGLTLSAPRKPALVSTSEVIPAELQLAHEMFEVEKRYAKRARSSEDRILRVVDSDYADADIVAEYQLDVLKLIRQLDETGRDVKVQATRTFAELPSDGTLPQRFVYAFPTYLTENKHRAGYAVFSLGRQRRLGAVFARNSVLLPPEDRRTLGHVLRSMRGADNSRIFSLQNFAMHEIVQQAVAQDPEVADAFDYNSIRTVTATPGRTYVPPDVGRENAKAAIFIFDLAGWKSVAAQIGKQPKGFLQGAQMVVLEHDLDIPVGIGLNRYASEWALQDRRWVELRRLMAKWANNEAFRIAMKELGVDVMPEDTANAVSGGAQSSVA